MEIWKDIKGYEGRYQVSNLGRVKNIKTGRVLKPGIRCGYPSVSLCKHNKGKNKLIHRLVAEAFILNPEDKPQVNHINGIKYDNRLDNLEWNTRSENGLHSYNSGLQISQKGEVHGKAKLTEEDILTIRSSNLSRKELAILYNISLSSIYNIIDRRVWKHI
jgi:hypothetical protein